MNFIAKYFKKDAAAKEALLHAKAAADKAKHEAAAERLKELSNTLSAIGIRVCCSYSYAANCPGQIAAYCSSSDGCVYRLVVYHGGGHELHKV